VCVCARACARARERESNVGNLNNIRRDASRHFRNKMKAYLKVKVEEPETNNKINKVRDL